MHLTRIEIENFKGVGERQLIDLKPITLLFGPNSAGKSTILQALHYVREILERGNCDPDQTIAGGTVGLGGFASLVHGHDLNRKIRIGVTIDIQGDPQAMERLPGHYGLGVGEESDEWGERLVPDDIQWNRRLELNYFWTLENNTKALKTVGAEFEISWSEQRQAPYVSCLSVYLDGKVIARAKSPPDLGRAILTDFNFNHDMLGAPVEEAPEPDDIDRDEHEERGEDFSSRAAVRQEIADDGRPGRFVHTLLTLSDSSRDDDSSVSFPLETPVGALPDINKQLKLVCRNFSREEFDATFEGHSETLVNADPGPHSNPETHWADELRSASDRISEVFDEMFLGPLRIARDCFERLTYIGPLREIPSRKFQARQMIDEARWAQGLAAWDVLHARSSAGLLQEVNQWLSGEGKLGTDYRLERTDIREIRIPGRMHQIFERGLTEEDLPELQELYQNLKVRTEVALNDFRQGVVVAPGDVGVGISQVIPVLVGCLRDVPGILAI
jgi:hypothetical protein